jgi:Flp pilus assembly protein TadD
MSYGSDGDRFSRPTAFAYDERGLCQARESKERDDAIADFSEAIRLKPDYIRACEQRGAAYAKKGDRPRAEADAGRAAALRGPLAAAQ